MRVNEEDQRRNRTIIAVMVVAVLILLVGLWFVVGDSDSDDEATTEPTSSSETVSFSPSESSTSEPARDDTHGDREAAEDAAEKSAPARKTAVKVIDEMGRTDRSTEEWRSAVGEYFTEDGRAQVEALSTEDIPFTKHTGDGELVLTYQPSDSIYPVRVPTDEGNWIVMLTRDGDRDWKVLSVSDMSQRAEEGQ